MIRPRRPTLLTALVAVALASGGCGPAAVAPTPTATASATPVPPSPSPTASPSPQASAGEVAAEDVRVDLELSRFDPEELTIPVGARVTFANLSPFEHTVTEGTGGRAVDNPIIDDQVAVGASTVHTFDEPGVYAITCRIHPSMQLTVTVEG